MHAEGCRLVARCGLDGNEGNRAGKRTLQLARVDKGKEVFVDLGALDERSDREGENAGEAVSATVAAGARPV